MTGSGSRGRVLIAGGSLAGLMAAAILMREGWEVRVFERVKGGIEGRGAGIATHDKLFEVFDRAGVKVDDQIGMRLVGRVAFDRQGDEIARFPFEQVLSPWGILYRRIRAAVPDRCYLLGKEVCGVAASAGGVGLTFADGTSEEGDLLIGADGIWSKVRESVFPESVPTYCGYVAWRGLVDENLFESAFANYYAPLHTFYIERGEQFIFYSVNGADDSLEEGRRRFGFLWYRTADAASELRQLLTDFEGVEHQHAIPPPKIAPARILELRRLARELLPPQFAMAVERTPQPFLQPIYDLSSTRIARDRIALIGDAAFVARPHVGAGVLKAACDVISLADALRDERDYASAFARYEKDRIPECRSLVDKARYLGGYLEGSARKGEAADVLPADEVIRDSGRGLT